MLADRTDGSSCGMGRASGPSPRRPHAAAPMRRLLGAAGPVRGFHGAPGRLSVTNSTAWLEGVRHSARRALASAHRLGDQRRAEGASVCIA